MASAPKPEHRDGGTCTCWQCAVDRDFEMPDAVMNACLDGDLVVFAGAGISTENRLVVPAPLVAEIEAELELDPLKERSFPEVMTTYEQAHGRPALLQRIKKHLDYVRSFPNIDGAASAFHRELAGVYTISNIFTTNWDDYFERECHCQPFMTEADWAFWRSADRKVFKLHGSISSAGSVVATEADYKRCYRNLNQGLMGAQLKTMLATKTLVFIGYSFGDSDFEAIYRLMKRRMGDLLPRAYIVTPTDAEPPDLVNDMHVIRTSGVRFVQGLKAGFPDSELLADNRFEVLPLMRGFVRELHHEMLAEGEMRDDPAMYLCACYHDGLMDAFDYIVANKGKGEFFHRCYTERLVGDVYQQHQERNLAEGAWQTVAYIEGYMNGLLFLISDDDDRKEVPLYLVFGHEGDPIKRREDFRKIAAQAPVLHPESFECAKRHASRLASGVVFQHMPVI